MFESVKTSLGADTKGLFLVLTIVSGKTRARKAAALIGAKKQVAQTHISKLQEGKGVTRKLLVGLPIKVVCLIRSTILSYKKLSPLVKN